MEKGTAPGISCAAISSGQDWSRLHCQNNNVDIHQELLSSQQPISPLSPPALFQPLTQINLCVCVCVFTSSASSWSVLYGKSHHMSLSLSKSVSLFLSLFLSFSLAALTFPYHGWTKWLPSHALSLSSPRLSPLCCSVNTERGFILWFVQFSCLRWRHFTIVFIL